MNLEEFIESISDLSKPLETLPDCLQALWWDKKGNWGKAHEIAQEVEESDGAWVHAYLHRVEGDLGNAAYWYSRAGKPVKKREDLDEEWRNITSELLGRI